MAKPVEIDVKINGIGAIRSELKALKGEIANATDPKDIERLSQAAGKLADQIADANERVRVFAAGSEFEKIGNGLSLVSTQLSSLDFEGAAESAKLLTNTIQKMNPAEIAAGFKAFASTVLELGTAFMTMGAQLLLNPIFLIVAVVVAIVAAIILLKDKIKIVGDAFNLLMIPIKGAIQLLKDLTDWLGLTSFAEDEAADKTVAANQKRIDSNKKVSDNMDKEFKRQIELAKANGKDVTDLQLQQARFQQNMSFQRVQSLQNEIDALEAKKLRQQGDERAATVKQLKDLYIAKNEQVNLNKDAANQILVIQAEAIKKGEEADKKAQDKKDAKDKKDAADKVKKAADDAKALDEQVKAEAEALNKRYEFLQSVTADGVGVVIEGQDKKNAAEDADAEAAAKRDQLVLFNAKLNYETQKAQRQKEINDRRTYAQMIATISTDLSNFIGDLEIAGIKKSKGLEDARKGLALVQIAFDTAMALSSAVKQATVAGAKAEAEIPIPGAGIAATILSYATTAAFIGTNIAKATSILGGSKSLNIPTSAGISSSGGYTSSTPLTPVVQLVGQRNAANNINIAETTPQGTNITVNAIVSETEITNKQAFIQKVKSSAEI